MSKRSPEHYVNNAQFSAAVVEYVERANKASDAGKPIPIVTNYIAECFLKIAEGLSHKSNFVRYTFREEMVMDAVENCLRAIKNYNLEAATRTGKPNAFAYFTQISWYAFLRRIQKEKKEQDIKLKFINESGLAQFMIDPEEDPESARAIQSFIDTLRKKIDDSKDKVVVEEKPIPETKKKTIIRKRKDSLDSDLMDFFLDDEE
jgi:hypothetical protein